MLTIPVWDLLSSYEGDSKIFSFEWPIFDWFFEDIQIIGDLSFKIKIIAIEDWISAIFSDLSAHISYEWKQDLIKISDFERQWKKRIDPLDPNDIHEINTKNMTINLKPVIREELIIAFHSQNI